MHIHPFWLLDKWMKYNFYRQACSKCSYAGIVFTQ